jgi:hypothetical protein
VTDTREPTSNPQRWLWLIAVALGWSFVLPLLLFALAVMWAYLGSLASVSFTLLGIVVPAYAVVMFTRYAIPRGAPLELWVAFLVGSILPALQAYGFARSAGMPVLGVLVAVAAVVLPALCAWAVARRPEYSRHPDEPSDSTQVSGVPPDI